MGTIFKDFANTSLREKGQKRTHRMKQVVEAFFPSQQQKPSAKVPNTIQFWLESTGKPSLPARVPLSVLMDHCRSSPGTLSHDQLWQWRAFELLLLWAAFAATEQPRESLWEVSDPLCYREGGRWPPTLSLLSRVFCCFSKYTQGCHLALKPLMLTGAHWCPLAPTDAHWHMRNDHAIAASRGFFHL